MNYIQKARRIESINDRLCVPLLDVPDTSIPFDEMRKCSAVNAVKPEKSTSILSQLAKNQIVYTNICGCTVRMISRIHDDVFVDEVIIRGERGNFYYVEINGEVYSIYKTIVIFAKRD